MESYALLFITREGLHTWYSGHFISAKTAKEEGRRHSRAYNLNFIGVVSEKHLKADE